MIQLVAESGGPESFDGILISYLLNPLLDFGLIETKTKGEWSDVTEKDDIRVTVLWKKFISFAWKGDLE
jgi:hypothetical protein